MCNVRGRHRWCAASTAGAFNHQIAAGVSWHRLPIATHIGDDAREWTGGGPGLVDVAPGNGVIMIMPVRSATRSTIGQRSLPITRWYHIQASGLIGSPTVPSKRSEVSLCLRATAHRL